MIRLSKRMQALADMIPEGVRLADIGTDHAYIPIDLALRHRISGAIAMDINRGPLHRADAHIREAGLSDVISTRLSDGLEKLLPDEADVVLIAGMGGPLMAGIMERGEHVLESVQTLILQPQSEISAFRHFLHSRHYRITDERMLIDEGKYYTILKVTHGDESYEDDASYTFGRVLLENRDDILFQFIQKELHLRQHILNQLSAQSTPHALQRIEEIKHEITVCREAVAWFERSEPHEGITDSGHL